MYIETLLFHAVELNRNVLFQTPSFCDHVWSNAKLKMTLVLLKVPIMCIPHYLSNNESVYLKNLDRKVD